MRKVSREKTCEFCGLIVSYESFTMNAKVVKIAYNYSLWYCKVNATVKVFTHIYNIFNLAGYMISYLKLSCKRYIHIAIYTSIYYKIII